MPIYTDSKEGLGDKSVSWGRLEPLITPAQLKNTQLFGLPMISGTKNPDTGLADRLTNETISDMIDNAQAEVETLTHMRLMPEQVAERQPFDPQEFQANGYMRLKERPVASVESVQIVTSDLTPVFTFNLDWVETGMLDQGQINVMPLLLTLRKHGSDGGGVVAQGAGNAYLSVFGGSRWMPALISVTYTVGFKDGKLPKIVNELIGVVAAINILSMLAPTYGKSSGSSLSIDGLSQSVSTPGPEIFNLRITELKEKRDTLVRKLKSKSGQSLFSGNV